MCGTRPVSQNAEKSEVQSSFSRLVRPVCRLSVDDDDQSLQKTPSTSPAGFVDVQTSVGIVKLALDLGSAARYVVVGTRLDPNLLVVGQHDFGQLDCALHRSQA